MSTSIYTDSEAVHLFIHLLLMANHEPRHFAHCGKMINIDRGQHLTGRHKLAEGLNMPLHLVRSRLTMLEDEGMIQVKSTNKFSLITICNYNTYQEQYNGKDQQEANRKLSGSQQETTNNNVKNENNEKNKSRRFAPPTLYEVQEYVKGKKYTDIDCHKWWNFYSAKDWMIGKNKMKDWRRAVATWHNFSMDETSVTEQTKKKEMDAFYEDYKKKEGIE